MTSELGEMKCGRSKIGRRQSTFGPVATGETLLIGDCSKYLNESVDTDEPNSHVAHTLQRGRQLIDFVQMFLQSGRMRLRLHN